MNCNVANLLLQDTLKCKLGLICFISGKGPRTLTYKCKIINTLMVDLS